MIAIFLVGFLFLGFLLAISGVNEGRQYNPMSPDEERKWLRSLGLTDEEIDDIQS